MAWHPTWNDDSEDRPTGRYRQVRMNWRSGRGGTPGVWWILGLSVVVYLLYPAPLIDRVTGEVVANARSVAVHDLGNMNLADVFFRGQVWRLLTFQFLHGSFNHIFFNMFIFWMFGRVVEMQVGTRRFLWMYLAAGAAGGLAECLFNLAMSGITGDAAWLSNGAIGASAGVMGVTMAFAMINPNAPVLLFFILPIPAKWLAIGTFVYESLPLLKMLRTGVAAGDNVAHAAHVGGMIYAFCWAVVNGYVNRPWAYRCKAMFDRTVGRLRAWRQARQSRPRPGPRRDHPVVRGPNTGSAGGASPRPRSRDEERLDGILRKIHEKGLMSLSNSERQFLRDMSERKRDDIGFDDQHRRQ